MRHVNCFCYASVEGSKARLCMRYTKVLTCKCERLILDNYKHKYSMRRKLDTVVPIREVSLMI